MIRSKKGLLGLCLAIDLTETNAITPATPAPFFTADLALQVFARSAFIVVFPDRSTNLDTLFDLLLDHAANAFDFLLQIARSVADRSARTIASRRSDTTARKVFVVGPVISRAVRTIDFNPADTAGTSAETVITSTTLLALIASPKSCAKTSANVCGIAASPCPHALVCGVIGTQVVATGCAKVDATSSTHAWVA